MTDKLAETTPSIGLSYSVQVGDGRSLVAQTFVARDCETSELNALLDKLRSACDRQQVFGKLETLELEIERTDKMLKDYKEVIDRLDARSKGSVTANGRPRPAAQQETKERETALTNIDVMKGQRAQLIEKKAALQKLVE